MPRSTDRDPLTRLSRAGTFQHRLDARAALMADSPDDTGFSVALVDVTRLRVVNREHGRAVGDAVLCEVASRLERAERADLVSRVGSDQFAVLGGTVPPDETRTWVRQFHRVGYEPPVEVEGAVIDVAVRVTSGWSPPARDRDLLWSLQREIERDKRTLLEQQLETLASDVAAMNESFRPGLEAMTQLERFKSLAEHDPPTSLLNRRGIEARLSQRGAPSAVAFIDIDDLREVNRLSGTWDSGDLAILGLATRLKDAFGPESTVRWAGDEFLVAAWDHDAAATAARLTSVLDDCRRTHVIEARAVTFSGGVAPCDGDFDASRRSAQRAVKRAKRKKNRVRLAD